MALEPRIDPTARSVESGDAQTACQPIWFGDDAHELFGWFHAARLPARDCVVVLCNPYGYDTMITHYSYRHLAERLADAGIAALRFDYFGTGDSSGDDAAPDRVDDWLASIDAARDEAMRRSGARAVALFGMRVGGLLALGAAQRRSVDDLVLLGPSASGRAAVRELRALRMLQPPVPGPGNPDGISPEDENFGFMLTEPMRAALGRLDPSKVSVAPARRALVIARDDIVGGEVALVDRLRACGVDVTASKTAGYSLALRGDPYTRDLPDDAWNEIVSWLGSVHPIALRRPRDVGASSPDHSAQTILGTVREQAVRFRGLFGIVTEPIDCTGTRARTAVILLNVGANHRIGSNRMYVRWARAWAELGFRVLRLDFAGMGDSPAPTGRPDKDVYSPNGMKETRAAIDFLAAKGCDKFALAGLCSGAYVAYYTALEDARVGGIIVVNPPTFHWKEGDSLELRTRNSFQATGFYARRALDAQTWRRALRGEVHVRAVATELARRMLARGRSKATDALVRLRIVRDPDEVARGFRNLCARGCEVLLVYGSNDGGIDVMEGHLGGGAKKLRHEHSFRLEILEGTDHTFTPRDAQLRLERLLTRYLRSFASPPCHRRDEPRR